MFFEKIRWKNLLSTGNQWTEFNFVDSKTTLIIGENGHGKSTLLDALMFALFGKPYRNINKPQLVNTINNKDLVVELEFTIDNKRYMIRRGLKPQLFEIYENENLINQTASAYDYQEYLEQSILRCNEKSLKQIVILGAASYTPLLQLTPMQRREVVENILDIDVFSIMSSLLKQQINEEKSASGSILTDISILKGKIEEQENILTNVIDNKTIQVSQVEKYIDDTKAKILEHENTLKETSIRITFYEFRKSEKTKLEQKISNFVEVRNSIADKCKKIEKEKKSIDSLTTCPTCLQEVNEDHKHNVLDEKETKLVTLTESLNEANKIIAERNEQLQEFADVENNLQNEIKKELAAKAEIKTLEAYILKLEKDIESYNVTYDTKAIETTLEEYRAKLTELEQKKKIQDDKQHLYDIATLMLKDSGIKAEIIKQAMPFINTKLNEYLHALDFHVVFNLDETFNETIVTPFRETYSYASFSEGEKTRIDLATLFTWRDVAKRRKNLKSNIHILDEVFDSSLDSNGVDSLLNIFESDKASNIIVISHKTDSYLDKFDRVIKVTKDKNFSSYEQIT